MMEELIEVLNQIKPEVNFAEEENLIDEELIDSFDLIEIATELSARFQVNITVKDATPENFQSVKTIYALILKLQGK